MVREEVVDHQKEELVVEGLMRVVEVLLFEPQQQDWILLAGWLQALLSILGFLHRQNSVQVMFPG